MALSFLLRWAVSILHDHEHDHGNVLTGIGMVLFIISAAELIGGRHFGSGPVIADGAEKLSDSVIALMSGTLLDRAEQRWSDRHWIRHNLRRGANAAVYGLAIALVGLFGLYESAYGDQNGLFQMTIGTVSFGVILGMSGLLHGRARGRQAGSRRETYLANAVHLQQDSFASAGIVMAGLLGLIAWPRLWNEAISLVILWWIVAHNYPQMQRLIREMHREGDCHEPTHGSHLPD